MEEHPTHKGYFVTEDGKVFSAWKRRGNGRWKNTIEIYIDLDNMVELKPFSNGKGYSMVGLRSSERLKSGRTKSKKVYVHRMVAETYLPNPCNLPEVNHINYIRNDNRVVNLEWCDRLSNVRHSNVLHRLTKGEIQIVPVEKVSYIPM
jgi:hypothetical protein